MTLFNNNDPLMKKKKLIEWLELHDKRTVKIDVCLVPVDKGEAWYTRQSKREFRSHELIAYYYHHKASILFDLEKRLNGEIKPEDEYAEAYFRPPKYMVQMEKRTQNQILKTLLGGDSLSNEGYRLEEYINVKKGRERESETTESSQKRSRIQEIYNPSKPPVLNSPHTTPPEEDGIQTDVYEDLYYDPLIDNPGYEVTKEGEGEGLNEEDPFETSFLSDEQDWGFVK
jgi:hypothetical protein